MLLKQADDKSKRLALLEDLQKSPLLDARQKKWLRDEPGELNAGIQIERYVGVLGKVGYAVEISYLQRA